MPYQPPVEQRQSVAACRPPVEACQPVELPVALYRLLAEEYQPPPVEVYRPVVRRQCHQSCPLPRRLVESPVEPEAYRRHQCTQLAV